MLLVPSLPCYDVHSVFMKDEVISLSIHSVTHSNLVYNMDDVNDDDRGIVIFYRLCIVVNGMGHFKCINHGNLHHNLTCVNMFQCKTAKEQHVRGNL